MVRMEAKEQDRWEKRRITVWAFPGSINGNDDSLSHTAAMQEHRTCPVHDSLHLCVQLNHFSDQEFGTGGLRYGHTMTPQERHSFPLKQEK